MITDTIYAEFEKLINRENFMEFAILQVPYRHYVFEGHSLEGRPTPTPFCIGVNKLTDETEYLVTLEYNGGPMVVQIKGQGYYNPEENVFSLHPGSMDETLGRLGVDNLSTIMFKLMAVNIDK